MWWILLSWILVVLIVSVLMYGPVILAYIIGCTYYMIKDRGDNDE